MSMTPAERRRMDNRAAAVDLTFGLRGGVIEAPYIEEDEDGTFWPGFVVVMPDGTKRTVLVSRDPEGNGPGHLFIDER